MDTDEQRIAWLLPAMGTGGISFQHILSEFTQKFPQTTAFTGQWPGFALGFEDSFKVQEVGATKYIKIAQTSQGYNVGFSYASPSIASRLLQLRPSAIFANAFSIWTAIALFLKPWGKWKVIIIYEGSSPGVDYRNSPIRLFSRRVMVQLADAFVVNSQAGKAYLTEVLGAKEERVFARPFLVPSLKALLQCPKNQALKTDTLTKHPIFLFVGQIIPRKGLKVLLEACSILKTWGYHDYTLLAIGDGAQRQELEIFAKSCGLETQVKWMGQVEYKRLGTYFQQADVFLFPTHEDIWGMVLTEAMAFGKPVLCSKEAGAVEMVAERENGFVFDPSQPEELAKCMRQFIDNPNLIAAMGEKSKQIMAHHTPEEATKSFTEAVAFVHSR